MHGGEEPIAIAIDRGVDTNYGIITDANGLSEQAPQPPEGLSKALAGSSGFRIAPQQGAEEVARVFTVSRTGAVRQEREWLARTEKTRPCLTLDTQMAQLSGAERAKEVRGWFGMSGSHLRERNFW